MAPTLSGTGSDNSAPSKAARPDAGSASALKGARSDAEHAATAAWAQPAPTHPQSPPKAHPYVLEGANVVLPTGTVRNGRLVINGTRIAADAPENAHTIDVRGHWLVPGFVDIHNHGGGGASFTSGTVDDVLHGIRTHRLHGTTTLVASTVTGDMDGLAHRAASSPNSPSRATSPASTSRARSSPPAARAPTPRNSSATPTRRTSAS